MENFFGSIWFQIVSLIIVATFHGYGAAWLAVRMLFRPHNPVKIFGLTIFPQGIIPRQRHHLAQAIGNAVGNELVSQETITDALFKTGFLRGKVETLVAAYAQDLVNRDFGSLLETLPVGMRSTVAEAIENLETRIGAYVIETLKSEQTAVAVREFVDRQGDKILAKRVSETLDENTFTEALQFVETRVRGILRERALEQRISDFVDSRVDELAVSNTALGAMFTTEFVNFFRERLLSQVQPIVHQIALIATSNRTREQIGALIKTEIGDYYGQLPFYQKFFVSREKLYKEVDDLINTALPKKVEDTLRGEAFALEAENFLNTTIETWLAHPLNELIGQIAPEKLENLKTQITGALVQFAQSDDMQRSVSAYLADTLHKIRPHSWRAIAERIHPEAATRLKKAATSSLLQILQRDETAETLNQIMSQQIERLLVLPIGKISDHVSPATVKNVGDAITNRIIDAAQERLPIAIKEFNIANLVREKVDNYPLTKLEALVLGVAGQHLRKIEMFGLVIGFLLGIAQSALLWATSAPR